MIHRFLLPLLLAVSAVLVFTRLGDRYLWEDEAQTALLAQNALATGVPVTRDGTHVVSQVCGFDADENYLATFPPWLPVYVTAAAFHVLGPSTVAARLPFAVLGWLCVPSLYLLGVRLFGDRRLALLGAAILACSVPFLLHVRQSRYYAIAIFAGVWLLFFALEAAAGSRAGVAGMVATATLLFHANHPMFVAALASLVIAVAVLGPGLRPALRVLAAAAIAIGVNAPWIVLYGRGWTAALQSEASMQNTVEARAAEVLDVFLGYLRKLDHVALPALVLVLFGVWLLGEGRRAVWTSPGFRRWLALLVFSVSFVAGISFVPAVFLRYVVLVVPALALALAYVVWTVGARRPLVAALAAIVVVGTDAAHGWASGVAFRLERAFLPVDSPLVRYVDEIAHHVDGPMQAVVRHLRAAARPGDRVYISYGDLPLRFYTGLEVRGGLACQSPVVMPPPEWVVVRFFFRTANQVPEMNEDLLRHWRYVREEIPWRLYRPIELPVVDTVWDSIPEPQWHQFRAPVTGTRVVIHRRVGAWEPSGASRSTRP